MQPLGPILEFEAEVSSGESLSVKRYKLVSRSWMIYQGEGIKEALINGAL